MRPRVDPELPGLDPDTRLGIYRIAQEALTNVLRHAGARSAEVELRRVDDGIRLLVTDDGTGLSERVGSGSGIRGMRERALLLGAELEVGARSQGGTRVCLHVPAHELGPAQGGSPGD